MVNMATFPTLDKECNLQTTHWVLFKIASYKLLTTLTRPLWVTSNPGEVSSQRSIHRHLQLLLQLRDIVGYTGEKEWERMEYVNIAIVEVITRFQSAQCTLVHKIRDIEQKQAYTDSLPVNPKIVYA